jgi:hypothetical protein
MAVELAEASTVKARILRTDISTPGCAKPSDGDAGMCQIDDDERAIKARFVAQNVRPTEREFPFGGRLLREIKGWVSMKGS